ncbi:MAG: hypothetical protein IH948_02425 [Bacteroidetes bacterium]|nr:hypothetical protein [Bacteroidota bacterium]
MRILGIPNIEIDAPGFTYAANYYGDHERSLYNNTKKIIGGNQLYFEKYPEIQTIMELEDLRQPQFNSFSNNTFVTPGWKYRYEVAFNQKKQRDALNSIISNNISITGKTGLNREDFASNKWIATSDLSNYLFEKFRFNDRNYSE